MVKRHKPSREAKAATHKASDEDYAKLSKAVVEAIVLKRKDVYIRFPYFVELDPTFPKGILYRRDEKFNWYRAKAFRLADWLYERNLLSQDAKGIVKSTRSVVNMLGEVDRLLTKPLTEHEDLLREDKIFVDSEDSPVYNVGS